ncbi:MAG: hypothetical protein QM788_04120 [Roseateles sp.]|uniref:hypothetical protein n=1 Tax=Roseateles sp. TaxID=1971397 RepID=UPI0039ECE529
MVLRLRPQTPRAGRERGAALVEFVVIAIFVLVPMYLATQAIAKLGDVRSASQNVARYATWERTVWYDDTASVYAAKNAPNQKSAAAIRQEALVRLFNDRTSGFKYSAGDKTATGLAHGTDPLWRDTAGKALVDDPAAIHLTLKDETPSKDLLAAAVGLINAVTVPSITGTLAPPVPTRTLAVVDFRLDKAGKDSEVYKRLWSKKAGLDADWAGLDCAARGAILSNTWAANASSGTKGMVSASVPTANGLGTALSVATTATLAAWDPTEIPRIDIGRIAVDVVPPDRLK